MWLKMRRTCLAVLLSVCLVGVPAGCSTSPATGERQFNPLSREREVELGKEAAPQFLKDYGGPIPSGTVRETVSDLGQQLAKVSERPDLPWEFHAVNTSQINAFALPGGKIFITRGLLEKMDSMAQLAGVLGHEVGHVTDRHVGERMGQAVGVNVATTVAGIFAQRSEEQWLQVLGVGAQVGGSLYLLKYSRGQEYTSDRLGLRYMTKVGYDPQGQVEVMKILKAAGGGNGIEWLSTHPAPQSRIDRLQRIIDEEYPNRSQYKRGEQRYRERVLQPMEGLPPAKDVPKQQQGG